jgi:hypothetical protein
MRPAIHPRLVLLLLAMLLAAAVIPAHALAQGSDEVIRDCAEDGDLDGDYSQEELDEAYENTPSDIDEYTNCREVIQSAREQSDGGGGNNDDSGSSPGSTGGGSSGGGATAPGGQGTDVDELNSRTENSKSDNAPTASVAGEELDSSGGTYAADADSDGMPTALIVALILVAIGALAGAAYLLRDHLPPSIASRLPGPLKPDSQV